MSRFCSNCGNEIDENAVVCLKCGCSVKKDGDNARDLSENAPTPKAGLILGILGIVFAWLFALAGHILSIIGIVVGIKEHKNTNKMLGLILSIVGEVCAILSSIMGAAIAATML